MSIDWTQLKSAADIQEKRLVEARRAAMIALRSWADALAAKVLEDFSAAEMAGWPRKEAASVAVLGSTDTAEDRGILQFEATRMGESLEALAQHVAAEANAYAPLAAEFTVRRRQLKAQIKDLTTVTEIQQAGASALVSAQAFEAAFWASQGA